MDGFTLAEQIQQQPELTGATIHDASCGHAGDHVGVGDLGLADYRNKPIKRRSCWPTI